MAPAAVTPKALTFNPLPFGKSPLCENKSLTNGTATNTTSSPTDSSSDKTDNPFNFKYSDADMRREDLRLKTFENWPVPFLSPRTLAQNGFYYLGRGDEVRCAFCKVEIMQWVEGDDPAKDHLRWAPQCPLIIQSTKQSPVSSVSSSPTSNGRDECGTRAPVTAPGSRPTPVHPQYANLAARLRTYKDWPRSMPQKPEDLAEAGFYYTGQGDKTKCFFCDGGLKDWEKDDIPWDEHARWFDRCYFVNFVKGRSFVQKVVTESCFVGAKAETPASPSPPPASTTVAPTNGTVTTDESTLEDTSKLCKICYDGERNILFYPCGHICACAKCAVSTEKCPVCRATIINAIRAYFQ